MKRSMEFKGSGMQQTNVSEKDGSKTIGSFVQPNPLSENETGLGVEINLGEGGEGVYTGKALFSVGEAGFGERVPSSEVPVEEKKNEKKKNAEKVISNNDNFISLGSASAFEGTESTYDKNDSDEDDDDRLIDCFY